MIKKIEPQQIVFLIIALLFLSSIFGKNLFPLVILAVLAPFVINKIKKYMDNENVVNMRPDINVKGIKKGAGLIIGIILAVLFLSFSIIIVPAGETGVYHLFGKVKDSEFKSGLHFKNPFALLTKMSIRTEEYTMTIIQGEGQVKNADAIRALTKEGLEVDLDITVLYRLEEGSASDVFKNVGLDYVKKIIRPSIRSGIREVIANYEAKDVYSEKRELAANEILERLKRDIDPRGIIIEEVLLRNVNLPTKLSNAIQEKLTAEQESQRYEFVLQKEGKEAERKRIEAAGQRDAQKIINESLTSDYLNYLYIRELKEREGTIYVPINPSTGMPMFKGL